MRTLEKSRRRSRNPLALKLKRKDTRKIPKSWLSLMYQPRRTLSLDQAGRGAEQRRCFPVALSSALSLTARN
jgi:hypothetical protein